MNKVREILRAQQHKQLARFYNINSLLGNEWAMFYFIIGSRMVGKSYAVTDYFCRRKHKLGDKCKVYWMRISETSTKALLCNKADKLVDPDLKRKYGLELTTKGMEVFDHGKQFCTVVPLSSFGKLKGVGFYDKDYDGEYILILDEFQLETGEKRTSFDILYNFIGMCENIARTTKSNIKVFLLGNTLEESSTILKAFNFMPDKFGRFYLKSKRCVIDNIEPTDEYLKDRQMSIADILGGKQMSNYTNEMNRSRKQLKTKYRLQKPTAIIKFTKNQSDWYTLWDGNIIRRYNNEHIDYVIAMRPYLNQYYNKELVQSVFDMYDAETLYYMNLVDQAYFTSALTLLRTK